MSFILELNPIIQALLATIFTWGVTALGASLVFAFKKINKNILDAMLGLAAGVMLLRFGLFYHQLLIWLIT